MKIEIVDYNPKWENDFIEEKNNLLRSLNKFNPIIEHIGSTSIKNLGAKPIIDIIIGFEKFEQLDLISNEMLSLNFTYYRIYNNVMPERRFFVKLEKSDTLPNLKYFDEGDISPKSIGYTPKVHCHCTTINNDFWKRHLAFRNYLIHNNNIKDDYNNLKRELAKRDWENPNDYTDAKTNFIKSIEQKALSIFK